MLVNEKGYSIKNVKKNSTPAEKRMLTEALQRNGWDNYADYALYLGRILNVAMNALREDFQEQKKQCLECMFTFTEPPEELYDIVDDFVEQIFE